MRSASSSARSSSSSSRKSKPLTTELLAPAGGQEALKSAFLTGLDVRRFQIKEPTLHDAFIALTGDHPDEDQTVARETLKAEAAR